MCQPKQHITSTQYTKKNMKHIFYGHKNAIYVTTTLGVFSFHR